MESGIQSNPPNIGDNFEASFNNLNFEGNFLEACEFEIDDTNGLKFKIMKACKIILHLFE